MKIFTRISFLILAFWAAFYSVGYSQLLLDENFSYTAGDLITNYGWTAHSGGGSQPITVSAAGLTYTGYVNSGIGNAALLDNTGEDDNKGFAPQSSGSVYVSFMVNVTTVAAGYFFHIGPAPIGTTFRGRVYMDASNHFGVGVGSGTAVYAASTFTPGSTYLLVLKYTIVGGTTNDQVSLYVFSSGMPSTEPGSPTIGPLTDATQADINPGSVALRQYSATQNLMVDGIRVGTSWSDIYANVVLPPPTNYPTAFAGAAVPFGINLSWTDATGGQVPTGYLILASNVNNIQPPVNGTPVPNDPNLAAGSGALNVLPGVQAASFSNLISSTPYYFKIFPYTNTGSNIAYKTDGTPPFVTVTTEDWVMINQQDFETQTFDPWDTISVASNKGWVIMPAPPATNYYAYINGFGGSAASEDWLISPSMDFNAFQNETFIFKTALNFTGPPLEIKISSDYVTGANPGTATWSSLTATLSPGGYTWTPSGNIDLSNFSGSNIHVAFKYISTSPSVAALWEVDDIKIYGKVSLLSTVTTNPTVSNITAYTATVGGDVTNDGGAVITSRGICYSTTPFPTIAGPKTVEPGTLGPFTSNLTGLLPNSTYHARAYATNVNGTAYGADITFNTLCDPFAPVPNFWASNVNLVAGQSINFYDSSIYCPDTWNWSFVGGVPMTSSAQNPTGITYNYPGDYNVCLTVTNAYGTQTLCKTAYIHVSGPTNANLVMTEIMYNPPESGNDSLEFIEIYNNGVLPVSLQNFYFSRGVDYTFPDVTLDPASYLVVAINGAAFSHAFGVDALQWTGGALSNQGEAIVLKDLYGYVIDSVYYKNTLPWDTLANGKGPSLELCDPSSNNTDPANWRHAFEFQTVNSEGDSIWASPFAGCSYPPLTDFTASDTAILKGESVIFTDASSASATSWEWTFPGGNPGSFSGKTPPPVRYDTVGAWDVILRASNNAGHMTKVRPGYIEVGPTGITTVTYGAGFSIYPNPSTGNFTVRLDRDENVTIRITDVLGNVVLEKKTDKSSNQVMLQGAGKGVYFVTLTGENGSQTRSQKLIIQ